MTGYESGEEMEEDNSDLHSFIDNIKQSRVPEAFDLFTVLFI